MYVSYVYISYICQIVLKNLLWFLAFYRQYKKCVITSPFTILCCSHLQTVFIFYKLFIIYKKEQSSDHDFSHSFLAMVFWPWYFGHSNWPWYFGHGISAMVFRPWYFGRPSEFGFEFWILSNFGHPIQAFIHIWHSKCHCDIQQFDKLEH